MKIIRISPEIHDAFKKLCTREKRGLTEGAELLINSALKKGTLKEVKQNVFNQIQNLDTTFRSFIKQQEKTYLRGISEDLVILSRRLKDVSTRTENEQLFNNGIIEILKLTNESHKKYEAILHEKAIERTKLFAVYKKTAIGLVIIGFLFLLSNFILRFNSDLNSINAENYHTLREYCLLVEKNHKGIKIIEPFDAWLNNKDSN